MGAWGAGNFENDDALGFLVDLDVSAGTSQLEELFDTVAAQGGDGEQIAATDAARALAAAELVAAARGHASRDFPDAAADFVRGLKKLSPALVEKTSSAVSFVLMSSELVELWAESGDPSEWNQTATDLIARIDAPVRAKKLSKKKRNEMTSMVCSFCGETIPLKELVSMDLKRPWSPVGVSWGIFAHEACLNAKLHARHIVQWWTPDA